MPMCAMAHSWAWRDPLICDRTHSMTHSMTHSDATWLIHGPLHPQRSLQCVHMWQASLMSRTWLLHTRVIWLTHVCHDSFMDHCIRNIRSLQCVHMWHASLSNIHSLQHVHMWHASPLMSVTWLLHTRDLTYTCMPWLIHMRHDSFIYTTTHSYKPRLIHPQHP